jgi:hypothetical protein
MKFHLTFFLLFIVSQLKAQDTIIVNNNYTFKAGIKISREGTAEIYDNDNLYYSVFGGGIQLIGKIKNCKSSIESGMYYTTKAKIYNSYYFFYPGNVVYTQYLTLPVNYRCDTKVLYVEGGVFFDYLVHRFSRYSISSIYDYGVDRKLNMGYDIAIGMEKQISRTVNFYFEGKLFDTVSSPKKDGGGLVTSNVKTTYRNYGVAFGVNYKFLKKG